MKDEELRGIFKKAGRAFLETEESNCLYLDLHYRRFALPLFQKESFDIVKQVLNLFKDNHYQSINNFIISPEYGFIHHLLHLRDDEFFQADIRKEFKDNPRELRQQVHIFSIFNRNSVSYWDKDIEFKLEPFINGVVENISDDNLNKINEYLNEDFINIEKRAAAIKSVISKEIKELETIYYIELSKQLFNSLSEDLIELAKLNHSH